MKANFSNGPYGHRAYGRTGLFLDRGPDKPQVKLLPEWLPRIEPVKEEVRSILCGADVCLLLTVSPIPEGDDHSLYEDIGIRHPRDRT